MGERKEKQYYFLKMPEDFFDDKKIKYLCSLSDGDKLTVVYIKILLKSLKKAGTLYYDGIMDSLEEEIALEIGEDFGKVKEAVELFKRVGLVTDTDESGERQIRIPDIENILLTETDAARRKRRQREKEAHEKEADNGNPFAQYSPEKPAV